MTIDQMFATLTHFRLQRQTLAKGLVNSAYAASDSSSSKSKVRIPRPGQKKFKPNRHKKINNTSAKSMTCNHCGMKYHEEKEVRSTDHHNTLIVVHFHLLI
ncbi:hypothetical protein V1507DRAFT_467299 [Lipomyces tetrasporus]